MTDNQSSAVVAPGSAVRDVIIIGAGMAGIHQLHALREAGIEAIALEAGGGVGGTWYWNRYPNCRFDSESYSYGYFFSKDLYNEWEWRERFSGQPETERYFNYVVDRFGLRDHIELNARVHSLTWDEPTGTWAVGIEDGRSLRSRYVIAATGILSDPFIPEIEGRETFRGEAHHTARWPKEGVDVRGKKVAIVGVGSTGAQVLTGILDDAESVTVFQRTAQWVVPLNNTPLSDEEQLAIRNFETIKEELRTSFKGFHHPRSTKRTFEDSPEQRRALYEKLWAAPGYGKVLGNYTDVGTDERANAEFSSFLAEKIREIVDDPATAEALVPKDHGFGYRRPPMQDGFLESFNRPHVSLVDLTKTPMERITETSIVTSDDEYPVDIIIWATGFDAVTGSLLKMNITGVDGITLREHWANGPTTYLGLQTTGFPNLFFPGGPHAPFSNFPRGVDPQVELVTSLLRRAIDRGGERIEVEADAEEAWTAELLKMGDAILGTDRGWYRGGRLPGKPRVLTLFPGGLSDYRQKVEEARANDYAGFRFTPADAIGQVHAAAPPPTVHWAS